MVRGKNKNNKDILNSCKQTNTDSSDYVHYREFIQRSIGSCLATLPAGVPLTIATRGVGFCAAEEFKTLTESLYNKRNSRINCTIHQYYRVELYLLFLKINLAYSEYYNLENDSCCASSTFLPASIRDLFFARIPFCMNNILNAVGPIKTASVWHTRAVTEPPQDDWTACALFIYPSNIRSLLLRLSDRNTSRDFRDGFYQLNPLPGARWEMTDDGQVLQNADDIWPDNYTEIQIQEDIRAFNSLLHKSSTKSIFISPIKLNERGSKSGLISFDPIPCRLESTFSFDSEDEKPYRYINDRVTVNPEVEVWSPDSSVEDFYFNVGAATMVGERSSICPTRDAINGKLVTYTRPLSQMNKFILNF